MSVELEVKLRIPDERLSEKLCADDFVREHLIEPFSDINMSAEYYDTAANELQDLKWSLRLRKEGAMSVAACKLMGSQEDGFLLREEWQCPAETIQEAIGALIEEGAPSRLSCFSDLQVRCRIEFIRRAAHLKFDDGSVAEMAIDTGTIIANDKSEALQEMELELLCGSPDKMLALASRLEDEYGLVKELSSKYARALRLIRSR